MLILWSGQLESQDIYPDLLLQHGGEFKWYEFYFLNVPCGPLMVWALHSSQVLSVPRLNESGQTPFLTQFMLSANQDFDKGTSIHMHYYRSEASARKCQPPPCPLINAMCPENMFSYSDLFSFSFYFWNCATWWCKLLLYFWALVPSSALNGSLSLDQA